jgi:carbonic anhydrase/acetyltransferase-like protein (isoleucine patch superfamily)
MPDTYVPAASTGLLYALNGVAPSIHPTAWVAPTAVLIGDVRLGPGANIWFNCVLRADTNPIIVGARSNIQDGTIIHVDHGENFTDIGDDVTVGHAAIIHACKLRNRAFIGMGATVLDGALVEEGGMLGARGLLAPAKKIGRYELFTGTPARLALCRPFRALSGRVDAGLNGGWQAGSRGLHFNP